MQALARRVAAPVFTLALFSSAALIFVLQPLFARMVTPLLGGSPQVWNASMAFFQGALLLGYLYAHLLARVKDLRIQAAIHGVVLLAAYFVLPVHVTSLLGEPNTDQPALWLLGVLTLSVGAPFAAAAATAPLLQSWYARTGRADASDPYYLYAASNLGSFGGLLAYPVIIEPLLGAHEQSFAWTAAYVFVGAMIVLSAAVAVTSHGETPKPLEHTGPAPTMRERLYWIAAAAVPSALSLGVTLHISTDVASAPMLWVIPLALYLATFVLAFMKGGESLGPATLLIQPIALALMIMSYYASGNWTASVGGILAGFFFSALVCHLALARSRPSADRLTEFYLYVSLGGVLGGAFAAFVAPLVFNNVYEYPLALAAACLFRPREPSETPRLTDASFAAAILMGVMALLLVWRISLDAVIITGTLGAAAAMIAAGWGDENKPPAYRYAFLAVAAVHAGITIWAAYTIAFGGGGVFEWITDEEERRLITRAPWNILLMASSFFVLAFCVHGTVQRKRDENRLEDYAMGAALASAVLLITLVLIGERLNADFATVIGILFCGLSIFINRGRPVVLALTVLIAFVIIFLDDTRGGRTLTQERSFFGVMRTREYATVDPAIPPLRALMHGTTLHGAQIAAPGYTRLPLTYYHPRTALGEAIVAGLSAQEPARLGLIGLGTGATACLMRPDDQLTIFEIDPAVVRLSVAQGGDFTFVPECQPDARVVLGDGRLKMAEQPDGAFDVIVVDAFSSDAIPAHLLTREAIALYLSKVSERGIVVLHLSNRHLALVSEALRVTADLNVPTLYRLSDSFTMDPPVLYGASAASVMIVARTPDVLTSLPLVNDWRVLNAPPGRAWSDDYINMPRALWEGLTGAEECRINERAPGCPGAAESAAPATPADPTSQ